MQTEQKSKLDKICFIIDKAFFFLAFAIAIPLAATFPDIACTGGYIHPEITIFWVVIIGIFLIEGLSLPTMAMFNAMKQVSFHGLTQLFSLGFIPVVVVLVVTFLHNQDLMPKLLRDGFVAKAAIPTTTSMCVMLSGKAGGNEALAAFNALLGNTLAIVITPLILGALTEISPDFEATSLAIGLCFKMVVPILVGQLIRFKLGPEALGAQMNKIVKTKQFLILCLLFQVLSDVFKEGGNASGEELWEILGLVVFFHYFFLATSWVLAGIVGLAPKDRVAFLMTSTQKTVILGAPMLRVVYADRSPGELGILLLPLVMYHMLELINGLVMSGKINQWVQKQTGLGQGEHQPLMKADNTLASGENNYIDIEGSNSN